MWGGGEGIKLYKVAVIEQPRDLMNSPGNITDNIVIATYGARWELDLWG